MCKSNLSSRRSTITSKDKQPVVVVVGGGYAGVAAAKALDRTGLFGVVMVDRKDYFAHSIGSLRSLTTQGHEQNVVIPYGDFLANGVVVRADIKEVRQSSVILNVAAKNKQSKKRRRSTESVVQDRLRYDYLVLATGSAYGAYGKSTAVTSRDDALRMYTQAYTAVEKSYDIAIVGGGPVGCQLAAELATAYKGTKRITIVQADMELTPGPYSELFRTKVSSSLQKLGVKVITGERVNTAELEEEMKLHNTIDTGYLLGKRVLRTSTRRELTTELVFFCTGTTTQDDAPYSEFLEESIDETGRIMVNKYFQVVGHKNVFAIGDCCNMDSEQRASLAQAHAAHAAQNIVNKHKHKEMERYSRNRYPGIKLALGATGGATQLPTEGGGVHGRVYTRQVKSKNLDVPRMWKSLHQTPKKVHKADKLREVASRLADEMPSEEFADIIPQHNNNNDTTTTTHKCPGTALADWCKKRNKVTKFVRKQQVRANRDAQRLSEITDLPIEQTRLWTAVPSLSSGSGTSNSNSAETLPAYHLSAGGEHGESDDSPAGEDDETDSTILGKKKPVTTTLSKTITASVTTTVTSRTREERNQKWALALENESSLEDSNYMYY